MRAYFLCHIKVLSNLPRRLVTYPVGQVDRKSLKH
jgi:hypothetical protein